MSKDQKLVTIAEYENTFDAELAKLTLDNEGIKSVILGDDLSVNLTYNSALFHVEIQVLASDAVRARQLLSEKGQPLDDDERV